MVSAHAVHALVTCSDDPDLLAKVNRFDIITPDGQPVRWALNTLHRVGLRDRVRGTDLMLRVCRAVAVRGMPIFLYGSSPDVLALWRPTSLPAARGFGLQGVTRPRSAR